MYKLAKVTSVIKKGETEGSPVYTRGGKIRFVGFPTTPTGSIALTGKVINFEGSYDGKAFFSLLDYRGIPVYILPKGAQGVIPANGLAPAPVNLPVQDAILFEGIQFIRPVANLAEAEERRIDFYYESADL